MNDDEQLLARLPAERRAVNGVPDQETARRRERAAAVAKVVLADLLYPGGVRTSPLGPAWSSDVDLHVHTAPDGAALERLGWLPMDGLLTALGSPGTGRWAIVEEGEILTMADIQVTLPADPVRSILARCKRRRSVRVREVLELRDLVRRGVPLPSRHPVMTAAADAETTLGGDLLRTWASGRRREAPVSLRGAFLRRSARRVLRRHGPSIAVALSGVDGSGKSSVARSIAGDLERIGVPATVVWTRPGMRIAWLAPLARWAKRLLREDVEPGVLQIAADPDRVLRSRRGALGRVWASLVTSSFLRDVRRRARRSGGGVIVYDRHLLDALVTLSFAYRGVDLSAHRRRVRNRMPQAAASYYLASTAEVAVARKPGDAIGEAAVRRQLEAYTTELAAMPEVMVLDGSRPTAELASEVMSGLLGAGAGDGAVRDGAVRDGASAAPRRR